MDLKTADLSEWILPSFGWFGKTIYMIISVVTIRVALLHNLLMSRVARQASQPFNIMIAIDSVERMIGVMCLEFKLFCMIWEFSVVDILGQNGCR